MVIISLKQSDGDGFLYETTTCTSNDDLISSLVSIHNKRIQCGILINSVRECLVRYQNEKDQNGGNNNSQTNIGVGLVENVVDDDEEEIEDIQAQYDRQCNNNQKSNDTPSSESNSISNSNSDCSKEMIEPDKQAPETLENTLIDLETYIDKSQVQKRNSINEKVLEDKILNVRGAILICYPMGLSGEEDHHTIINETLNSMLPTSLQMPKKNTKKKDPSVQLPAQNNHPLLMNPNKANLWVAGKKFQRNQFIYDRLGKNEKQKIIAKLTCGEDEENPPQREPMVSEEERNAMMAYYFKRQEELKKLAESEDDEYLNSAWADPKQMKRSLQGLGNIRAPGSKMF